MNWVDEFIKFCTESTSTVAVVCSLAGGLAVALVNYIKNKNDFNIRYQTQTRNQNRDQFEVILQERKQESRDNKDEIKELYKQLNTLQDKVAALEAILARRPFPEWVLSFGKYTWCNMVMEYLFLSPMGKNASWLIGKSPDEVWTPDVAKVLVQLDNFSKISEYHVAYTHNVKIHDKDYTIIKYGNIDSVSGRILNCYGMAIPQAAMILS